jgi:acetyl-CoA carboxylase/biotin carboxylase 1
VLHLKLMRKPRSPSILAGYKGDPEAAAAEILANVADDVEAAAIVTGTLNEFIRVEKLFAGKLLDDVVRDLTKANTNNLEVVISEGQAHQQLANRKKLVLSLLRQVGTLSERFGSTEMAPELKTVLKTMADMKEKAYGEIALAADELIRQSEIPSFVSRCDELRKQLRDGATDLAALSQSPTLSAGVDLLTSLFADEDPAVRSAGRRSVRPPCLPGPSLRRRFCH